MTEYKGNLDAVATRKMNRLRKVRGGMGQSDQLVHLITTPNEAIAGMWRGLLERQGIRVLIQPMGLSAYFGASSPCRVMVRQEQAEDARLLLENSEGEEKPVAEDSIEE